MLKAYQIELQKSQTKPCVSVESLLQMTTTLKNEKN